MRLRKELEVVKLGPDTGDLSMWFWFHSGPVTGRRPSAASGLKPSSVTPSIQPLVWRGNHMLFSALCLYSQHPIIVKAHLLGVANLPKALRAQQDSGISSDRGSPRRR
jgi:hypothetical protein